MKIKEGYVLRSLCGNHIVTAEGLGLIDCNHMITLNDSAAYLWENIQGKEFTEEDLADLLIDKYEIVREIALADSVKLIQAWRNAGVLE